MIRILNDLEFVCEDNMCAFGRWHIYKCMRREEERNATYPYHVNKANEEW
jgi:hypothetical protein